MRRAFFFILAVLFANASFALIPRVSILDDAPAIDTPSAETRVRASDVLAPFERPAEGELTRALRQGYEQAGTTNASGLGRFLSVDPVVDPRALRRPQAWNRYSYVLNNPLRYTDPTGMLWFKLEDKWTYLKDTDEITQVAANKDGSTTTTVIKGVKFGLVFNGTALTQLREDGTTRTLPAVSGRVSGWGEVHPGQQGDRNRGPIPEGQYSFTPADIQTIGARDRVLGLFNRGAWPGSTYAWGKQRAFLTPSPGTNTRGRSGFSIHGGRQPGSAGCIDLCDMVSVFFGEIPRNAGEIPVDVDYSDPLP